MSKKASGSNPFKQAVAATEQIKEAYKPGLQAFLKRDKDKIQLSTPADCEGSVDIDSTVKALYPQENRWDYCLSYQGETYFVEIHSANTSEVDTVIRKLNWLKEWLRVHAPGINSLKATSKPPYYWVQSNGFHILPNSAQYRRMINERIKPVARLEL